eukprot:2442314-Prymnesium_polylepis.1
MLSGEFFCRRRHRAAGSHRDSQRDEEVHRKHLEDQQPVVSKRDRLLHQQRQQRRALPPLADRLVDTVERHVRIRFAVGYQLQRPRGALVEGVGRALASDVANLVVSQQVSSDAERDDILAGKVPVRQMIGRVHEPHHLARAKVILVPKISGDLQPEVVQPTPADHGCPPVLAIARVTLRVVEDNLEGEEAPENSDGIAERSVNQIDLFL